MECSGIEACKRILSTRMEKLRQYTSRFHHSTLNENDDVCGSDWNVNGLGDIGTTAVVPHTDTTLECAMNNAEKFLLERNINLPSAVKIEVCKVEGSAAKAVPEEVAEDVEVGDPQEEENEYVFVDLLSLEEFQSLHSYLKGHLQLTSVNAFVALMNAALKHKYMLFNAPFQKLTKKEKNQVIAYRDQEIKQSQGREFVVLDDIKKEAPKHGCKELSLINKLIPILRHTKRIEEIRGNKLTRYAPI